MPFILAMLKIDYLSQVMFSDAVEVGSRVDWIGRTSIGMSHLLVNQEGASWPAPRRVLVAFDYGVEKPMPVPDDWRATWSATRAARSIARWPPA